MPVWTWKAKMKLLQLQKRSMALAGSILTVYLVFHMLSNLTFFAGSAFEDFYEFYNQAWLRWPLLIIVLACLAIHIKAAIAIRMKNSQARKQSYYKHDKLHIPANLVSLSVVLLFVFIAVHIIQSLFIDTEAVKLAVMTWFSSTTMVLFYLAGIFILVMHLQHSLVNVMQTLGITSNMYKIAIISGVMLLGLGFAAIPVYVWVMS